MEVKQWVPVLSYAQKVKRERTMPSNRTKYSEEMREQTAKHIMKYFGETVYSVGPCDKEVYRNLDNDGKWD